MSCPPHRSARAERKQARVLLVDDHPLLRQGIVEQLSREPDLAVCGEAGDAREAMRMAAGLEPDLAVVDIAIPGRDGIELIRDLRAAQPGIRILVLSMFPEALYAERALRAGAGGYVMKSDAPDRLIEAIREVLKGHVSVSDAGKDRILRRIGYGPAEKRVGVDLLSDRELEVFRLVGEGSTTRNIAKRLSVSVSTVESHRAAIKTKLDLKNAAELAARAAHFAGSQRKSR